MSPGFRRLLVYTAYNTFYAGAWRYLTFTFDDAGNAQKSYVNGALITSTSFSPSIAFTGQGANTIIGKHSYNDVGYDFDGTIDVIGRLISRPRRVGLDISKRLSARAHPDASATWHTNATDRSRRVRG